MHTSIIYAVAWGVVLCLSMAFQTPINYEIPYSLLWFLMVSGILLFLVDRAIPFVKASPSKNIKIFRAKNPLGEKLLVSCFVTALILSSAYSKFQFPILKIVGLPAVEYNEFGIPGIQGFVNATYLAMVTIRFYCVLVNGKNPVTRLSFLILILYPLAMLSRQLLASLFIQLFLLWWIFSGRTLRQKLFVLLMAGVAGIAVFGILGNVRTGDDVISSFLGDDARVELAILYWFYVYAVSPTSNLALNIDSAQPDGSLATFMSSLLPTPVRQLFGLDQGFAGYSNALFVNDNLNMATYFAPGYLSFGWIGMIAMFLFLLLAFVLIKKNAKRNSYLMMCYPVIVQVCAFAPFTNLLFYLPVAFQIIIFVCLGEMRLTGQRARLSPGRRPVDSGPLSPSQDKEVLS